MATNTRYAFVISIMIGKKSPAIWQRKSVDLFTSKKETVNGDNVDDYRLEIGIVYAIDPHLRVRVRDCEIYAPLHKVREALSRPPAIDNNEIVSWGNFSKEEALSLIELEPDEAMRQTTREIITEEYEAQPAADLMWCIYYALVS